MESHTIYVCELSCGAWLVWIQILRLLCVEIISGSLGEGPNHVQTIREPVALAGPARVLPGVESGQRGINRVRRRTSADLARGPAGGSRPIRSAGSAGIQKPPHR